MKSIDDLQRKLDKLLMEPGNSRLFNEIGILLYQMNDPENAGAYLQRAYQLCPADLDILSNYAFVLYSQCRWQEAVPIYQAYLALDPNHAEVREKLRDLYYQLGEYQEAAKIANNSRKDMLDD